ncbi:MAG: Na+/H+ antiporter [Eggerthellaceae bacterium]|nr:Na+/H+ antiporter [Eggerthellaceae bacterium]
METFELIVLLLAAVLASAALEQVIPRVSLPLIQIAIGFLMALAQITPGNIQLAPEFFLVVFIAPLLFHDAMEADKHALWRNRNLILSLAIGLVLAIMLTVGFAINLLEPSIPLAAAFALGAALGPTDAVAVASLSKVAKLTRTESALLSGESLLNDASGVVAFQFATAAAVTGAFSLAQATTTLVTMFVGGIALGAVLGWIGHTIRNGARSLGLDSTTFHVLFEIAMPFIVYLLSERVGVSGILAVVAAGITMTVFTDRKIGPALSELSIVSQSVWNVLSFALNGLVFTLLGMQLPNAMQDTWDDVTIGNSTIVLYIVAITAILFLVRFLWVLAMNYLAKDPETGGRFATEEGHVRSALVTTIGGAKGAVTLSVIFSTPLLLADGTTFPQRDLLIFLASGVILLTLALANFLLPILAPNKQATSEELAEEQAQAKIEILRAVIDRLAALRTRENSRPVMAVISSYNHRIDRLRSEADLEDEDTTALRIDVVNHQLNFVASKMEAGEIGDWEGFKYIERLSQAKKYLKKADDKTLDLQRLHRWKNRLRSRISRLRTHATDSEEAQLLLEVQISSQEEAIRYLSQLFQSDDDTYTTDALTRVMLTYRQALRAAQASRPSVTAYTHVTDKMYTVERTAYTIELDEIQKALDEGKISRKYAKSLRDSVYLMLVDLEMDL